MAIHRLNLHSQEVRERDLSPDFAESGASAGANGKTRRIGKCRIQKAYGIQPVKVAEFPIRHLTRNYPIAKCLAMHAQDGRHFSQGNQRVPERRFEVRPRGMAVKSISRLRCVVHKMLPRAVEFTD